MTRGGRILGEEVPKRPPSMIQWLGCYWSSGRGVTDETKEEDTGMEEEEQSEDGNGTGRLSGQAPEEETERVT